METPRTNERAIGCKATKQTKRAIPLEATTAKKRATSRKTTMLEKRPYENLLRGGQGRSAESIVESAFVVAACLVTAVLVGCYQIVWG